MRERVVFRAVVGLVGCALVACGGGSGDPPADAPVIDAVDVDAPETDATEVDAPPPAPCNPLAAVGQQGCISGQKCTWITVQETPTYQGVLGCVPDGDVAVHGACVQGAAGASTGFDDCAAGLICITGECRDICGFDGSQSAACASVDFCARYQNLFSDGPDEAPYGACNVGCEPLTQLRSDGQPCGTGKGCYVLIQQTRTIAVCATAGIAQVGQSASSADSCVPGAMPRERGPGGGLECGGLCRMVDVTSTLNTASEGGVSPDSCNERWGVAQPSDTTAGESCRYLWSREPFSGLSPFSNTVGWCYKHAAYTWDTDGNGSQDAPFPRCANLTTGDVIAPFGNNDALYFWCLTKPVLLTGAIDGVNRAMAAREPRLDRLTRWRQ